jgi:hypothetical protein
MALLCCMHKVGGSIIFFAKAVAKDVNSRENRKL